MTCPPTTARWFSTLAFSTLALLLGACGADDPVLPGVPERLVEAPAEQATPDAVDPDAGYALPEGVLVDIQYLTGRPLTEIRGDVLAQLGAFVSATDLENGKGEEIILERGRVRVLDDRVYLISFDLPQPLRRAQVLALLGLPPQVSETIQTHREYRLNHERGFRRIRMVRQSRDNELVTHVEVWRFLPGEHQGRR